MHRAKIGIVDDEAGVRDALVALLTENHFEPIPMESSAEFLAMRETVGFDLALIDLQLKGESGLALAMDIRSKGDLPIVMLTGRGDETDKIVGLEVGADDYDALLQFVYENDFKFNDFLELKKEFEGKGIVFHDGSFVNEVNENDIELLGICLDKFVNQYQERFTGLTDDKEKRVKEFQNSLHYS